MKYQSIVICHSCDNCMKLSEEQAIESISKGLWAAKRMSSATIYFKKMYYPFLVCPQCYSEVLVDENISFEKITPNMFPDK